mgnify:CR=1 FL=1
MLFAWGLALAWEGRGAHYVVLTPLETVLTDTPRR